MNEPPGRTPTAATPKYPPNDSEMTPTDTELHDLSLVQLAELLRQRKVSALETAQHFLARAGSP